MLTEDPRPSIAEIARRLGENREALYREARFQRFRDAAERFGIMKPKGLHSEGVRKGHKGKDGTVEAYEGKIPAQPKRKAKSDDD